MCYMCGKQDWEIKLKQDAFTYFSFSKILVFGEDINNVRWEILAVDSLIKIKAKHSFPPLISIVFYTFVLSFGGSDWEWVMIASHFETQ